MKARLTILEGALSRLFKTAKPRLPQDPHYAQFRAECRKLGITYTINRDGYIDFSDGNCFPHYDWQESLTRLLRKDFS